jgi:hypothetical protein
MRPLIIASHSEGKQDVAWRHIVICCGGFNRFKFDLVGPCDPFRDIQNSRGDEIALLILIKNDNTNEIGFGRRSHFHRLFLGKILHIAHIPKI